MRDACVRLECIYVRVRACMSVGVGVGGGLHA